MRTEQFLSVSTRRIAARRLLNDVRARPDTVSRFVRDHLLDQREIWALERTYESEASFNRAFRREYRLPPGRYRRAAVT